MKNLFIGVDFSKEKVDVAIIFADGLTETAARVFNGFKTTVSGYKQLVKWVEQNSYGIDSSLWLFCGENTGDYSKGLCNFLYGKGYDMWLENAKSIKDASGLRRLKSDRADASMIAEYAMRNYDKAIMYEPLSESLAQLRELFLYRQMVVRHKCSFQVRRGEKRLTLEKSPIKTMISQSGRHIVSELNKEVEKINKRIAELTGGYQLFMPLMIVCISSLLTISIFESHSIYALRLAREGKLLTHHVDRSALTLMSMQSMVEKDYHAISPDLPMSKLVSEISRSNNNFLPVLNDAGVLEGVIDITRLRHIIFRTELYNHFKVSQLMIQPSATLSENEPMDEVMAKFDKTDAAQLPVVDVNGILKGYISRTKIYEVYRQIVADMSAE